MAGSGGDDFERFFRAQAPSVAATVFRVVGDAAVAEELTQEAFFKAALRWRRLRRYDRPGAWVRRVAIRDAVRASRREQRYDRRQPVEAAANQRSLNGWSTEDGLTDGRLWSAVLALPGKQRAAVALYYLDDRPTAEGTDCPDGRPPSAVSEVVTAKVKDGAVSELSRSDAVVQECA